MTPRFKVVIPARHASTRLPGKPLLMIAGKPMIAHVCEKALQAGAEDIVVATDDERIINAVSVLGIKAVMTRVDHQSGTERIAEVAELCGWADHEVIVNVQGDEPLIPPALIFGLAETLANQQQAGIATLAAKIHDEAEIFNPNAVKVVINNDGNALYFSRAPIPWDRDGFAANKQPSGKIDYYRHIGMYCYTVEFLRKYCSWEPSVLETVEALEQLRILWYGERIKVNIIDATPPAGVDTAEDLARVEQLMSH
ncbi:MAG: 3-deoxy-manno-octulosonate cytidylyltransferase [Gammaproteobacteria bacterium]|nr:3-deoxy-manno-octulosonate cytidylyltransferase [Gammaproteobacteria bacterium]